LQNLIGADHLEDLSLRDLRLEGDYHYIVIKGIGIWTGFIRLSTGLL